MLFKHAEIFTPQGFVRGAFTVEDGRFGEILPQSPDMPGTDLGGARVIPGLIDIHNHGNSGADFSDGDPDGIRTMARYLAKNGVTSFAPASMTLPYDVLARAFRAAADYNRAAHPGCARLMGIQMEGPFFSEKKKGAQNGAYLRLPDFEAFRALYEASEGLLRIVDVAAELPGAVDFAAQAAKLCTVSIAHTDCSYEDAAAVFAAGARHLTHLYNAMPGIHHRDPGVIPAAVENPNVRAELICDGYHIHPAAVRLAFAMFGGERMILVSDSGRCAGLPEGSKFTLGGQDAWLKDGVGRLGDGTIACSAANLWGCLVNVLSWGIREEDALRAATWNPACAIGAQKEVGSIEEGKVADFILCNPDYTEKRVFLAGKELSYLNDSPAIER